MRHLLGSLGLAVFMLVLGLSGCATTGENAGPSATAGGQGATSVPGPSSGTEGGGGPGQSTTGQAETFASEAPAPVAMDPLEDPSSPLAQRVIYFDFDRSTVRDEYLDLIKAHAHYLLEHPNRNVTLEGHTDERGSREYNLALGEQRAKAVRDLLMLEGVSADQIAIVSYGEERPAATGHDEASWQRNRRVVIVY